MGDIIEFLESRISEDEAAAREGLGRMETGAQFTGTIPTTKKAGQSMDCSG